ncbi:MAG: HU family DNA-binding protein [Gemmatimonadota bacterium]|nr:HU family DNA-binding protein [Gemmatimonadota bacterium]
MNKAQLVEQVAAATGQNKQVTRKVVEGLIEEIAHSLATGNNIEIRGFGSFKVKKRMGRTARNPRTGEPVQVPSRFVPAFKPSRTLSTAVADKGKK